MTSAQRTRRLDHQGLVYGTDEQFLAGTAPFCREGLDRDDVVLAVTTTANIGHLRDSLGADAHRVEFVDSTAWYDAPGRTLAAYHRYVDERSDGRRRIRIVGEPVWHGRDVLETAEWTRYESIINLAFADSAAWIVCPYDTRAVPAAVVDDVRRTHPDVVTGPLAEPSPAFVAPGLFDSGDHRSTDTGRDPGTVLRFAGDLAAVRGFAETTAAALGMSPTRIDGFVIAVNEVATNTVQHGGGSGRIALRRAGDRVVCDITDHGADPTVDWYAGYLPPDPAHPRGHGLWVARQLCDLLQIHASADGTAVRLHHRVT
ncbi:sensor histidine kinase [Umezawaea sp. Da 62-37]|uniref:sensor histidine kinase n=1 Tax=Umezawaea sp. Da 62-37 TaxID=3075927 RepID=UPI0028F74634|nr:sensor histidine kinase [Umezawaea sp. Da 62-37]WNV85590.1 sensor histidine kinase [Umezawaea sp. Da 62-37]